jgi:ABC-type multidrug transport system fused ATPase/permease subunit
VEGRIVIDGIDISTIGLHDLRSRVVRFFFNLYRVVGADARANRRLYHK